mgnify:CR=1 FL=1
MAGLTKTKSDALPFPNLTKNPKELPLTHSKGSGGFNIVATSTTTATPVQADFWGSGCWTSMGSYNDNSGTNTDLTLVDINNSSKPIIVGNIMTRYPNLGSATTTFKITVDGIYHEFTHTHTYSSQIMLGHLTNLTHSGTGGGKRGLRFGLKDENYGVGSTGIAWGNNAVIEDAMDLLNNGYPVLYAEHSMTVKVNTSAVYNAVYWRYQGVTWRYLTG